MKLRFAPTRAAALALVCLLALLTACGGGDDEPAAPSGTSAGAGYENPDEGVTKDAIKLGWIGDMTGPVSPTTLPIFQAIEAYFEKVNAEGGIHGRKVEVIGKSDEYQGPKAVVAFKELIQNEKVLAIAGIAGSPGVVGTLREAEAGDVPIVGSAQTIFDQLRVPNYYNLAATYLDVADVVLNKYAPEVLQLSKPRVVTVGLDAPSGLEWGEIVKNRCAKGKCEYVKHIPVPVAGQDFSAQAQDLARTKPDLVMLHGTAGTATVLLNSMAKAGVAIPTVGTFPTTVDRVWQSTPESVNKLFAGFHWVTPPGADVPAAKEMVEAARKLGVDAKATDFTHGWVTAMVLHEAIEKAGPELNRASLKKALESMTSFDTGGLTATVDLSDKMHHGIRVPRPYVWDPAAKAPKPVGDFEDYRDALSGDYADFLK